MNKKPKFWRPYPKFLITGKRSTGGGGGMTGELGFDVVMNFLYGNSANNETAGNVSLASEYQSTSIGSVNFHFMIMPRRVLGEEEEREWYVDQCRPFVQAAAIAFKGHELRHVCPKPIDAEYGARELLESLGVKVYGPFEDNPSVRARSLTFPRLACPRSKETTSVSVYDAFNDDLQTLILINTPNLKRELGELVDVLRSNREELISFCEKQKPYFDWVRERDLKEVRVPFVKLQEKRP